MLTYYIVILIVIDDSCHN